MCKRKQADGATATLRVCGGRSGNRRQHPPLLPSSLSGSGVSGCPRAEILLACSEGEIIPEKRPMTYLEEEKSKSFAAYSPGEARLAATLWLGDFKDHGPLRIKSIRVTEERDLFVATVAYSEGKVENSPRYLVL